MKSCRYVKQKQRRSSDRVVLPHHISKSDTSHAQSSYSCFKQPTYNRTLQDIVTKIFVGHWNRDDDIIDVINHHILESQGLLLCV